MISTNRLADMFVEIADTLVDDYDLVDFLHHLTVHAAEVSGAQAVGLLLADHRDELQFMAASNENGRLLELLQLNRSQGPCWDCFQSQVPVSNGRLDLAADLWPAFAPAAWAMGFRSVHVFPLRLRDRGIGAMGLFGTEELQFEEGDTRLVQAMADVATVAILQERAVQRAEALVEQLQGALTSRVIIEQAKGAVSQRLGITPDQAFELLRTRARSANLRIAEVARASLESPQPTA